MAVMPGVPFLGIRDNGSMSGWDILVIHTIVGFQAGGNAAHWTTGASGKIVQARDTRYRSAANLNGNSHCLAIENEDHGPAYGAWSGSNVPRFTDAQAHAIAQIIVWCHRIHGIPIQLVPDSKPGRRGIAYHRQGIDGNFTGPYLGRVSGGELWSSSVGKVCPGEKRIAQLVNEIIPLARRLAGIDNTADVGEELDMAGYVLPPTLEGEVREVAIPLPWVGGKGGANNVTAVINNTNGETHIAVAHWRGLDGGAAKSVPTSIPDGTDVAPLGFKSCGMAPPNVGSLIIDYSSELGASVSVEAWR